MADAVEKPRRSAYSGRFILAYALVALVFGGVIMLFAFLVSQNETPPWSTFQPKGNGLDRAQNIANHVGRKYLERGETLVAVNAQRPIINSAPVDAFAIARPPSSNVGGGIEKLESAENSIMYVFCGQGQRCSIPGEPSAERALLLHRESLELALYTFKYMDDVDSVVTFLPPVGRINTAGYFRRSSVRRLLDRPLFKSLPAAGPFETEGGIFEDAELSERISSGRFFQSDVQQLPTGGALLILTRAALQP